MPTPKNILVDINIFIDVFQKRIGYQASAQVLSLSKSPADTICISAHSVTTICYLLEKAGGNAVDIAQSIDWMVSDFTVISTTQRSLKLALQSQITDYEDAVVEQAALKAGATVIITRNLKDFDRSLIKALTQEAYVATL